MNWYLEVLKKYAVFNGRARRKEYWMFTLFNFIIAFALSFGEAVMGTGGGSAFTPVTMLYLLAVLIPGLAVTIRRLHDINRSGWWFFIGLVPFVGPIVLLVFTVQAGTPGNNDYGPDPKSPTSGPTYQKPTPTPTPVG